MSTLWLDRKLAVTSSTAVLPAGSSVRLKNMDGLRIETAGARVVFGLELVEADAADHSGVVAQGDDPAQSGACEAILFQELQHGSRIVYGVRSRAADVGHDPFIGAQVEIAFSIGG